MPTAITVPGLPSGAPLWLTLAGLFVVVMLRSHATYWLARFAAQGTDLAVHRDHHRLSHKVAAWIDAPVTQRATRTLGRWGAPAVSLAYVTIGFQTAILVAAGLIRMPYLRFTLASIPGAIAWAVIWGTIGFGVFWGAVRVGAASPWALLAIIAGVLVLLALLARRRHAAPKQPGAQETTAPAAHV